MTQKCTFHLGGPSTCSDAYFINVMALIIFSHSHCKYVIIPRRDIAENHVMCSMARNIWCDDVIVNGNSCGQSEDNAVKVCFWVDDQDSS